MKRIESIEGIRALAIIGIICYHLDKQLLSGGYYGVNIFLMLSGYFLMNKFAKVPTQNGKIIVDIKYFLNQIKKLFIPMMTMILFVVAYITLFQPNMLLVVKKHIVATVLFFNNYWQIIIGTSYFDTYLNQSPFTHLWYLALNVQFYLLVAVLLYWLPKRKLPKAFAVIILTSIVTMIVFSFNITISYYSYARAFSFFLGCLLALVYPMAYISKNIPKRQLHSKTIVSLLLLSILLSIIFNVSDENMLSYYGLFFIFDIVFVLFLMLAIHPNTLFNKVLSSDVLTWVGRRSYYYYLWYFPIIHLYHIKVESMAENTIVHFIIQVILIMGLSEVHYHFKYYFEKLNGLNYFKKSLYSLLAIGSFVSGYGLVFAKVEENTDTQTMKAILENTVIESSTTSTDEVNHNADNTQVDTQNSHQSKTTNAVKSSDKVFTYLKQEEIDYVKQLKATFIGDSTLGMLKYEFNKVFPQSTSDWNVGRQLYKTKPVVTQLKASGQLADVVVFSLGVNGSFKESHIVELIEATGKDKKIFFVNNSMPKSYRNANNELFNQMAQKYSNVKVIDWYGVSKDKKEWFYNDLIHVNLEEG